jgi:hypothetical protein
LFKIFMNVCVSLSAGLAVCALIAPCAFAQQSPVFTPGNLVVVVEGCGVQDGTCTAVPNGTGTGADNSSSGGYGDNQAGPLTLFQFTPNGSASVTYVNSLVLPQTGSGANLPVSGEYGSSSEGQLQLDGTSRYLTLMGYGINAATFDAAYYPGFTTDPYGAAPSGALAQSGSLTGQSYTPIPRVLSLIDPYGNVNSATALYNVFNTNNPRSVYTVDGTSVGYVSGQGSGCDETGGVFLFPIGAPDSAPTAITGGDASPTSSCVSSGYTGTSITQDTRDVQIYNNTLYVSADSTEGKSDNRSLIGTLGTPPATSLFAPTNPPTGYTTGPNLITGLGNTGGTGKVTITSGSSSNGNGFNSGVQINISPVNFFFASPSVLYVTDSGNPKNTSANSNLGDGGLQKWVNSQSNGSGTWSLAYTLYKGLNLVKNPTNTPANTSGATGLYGLAGVVSGNTVNLYVTNYTIADLDPTYLYGITDTLSTTTNPGTSFTQLAAAPQDSNFKGVSFAPALPDGSATITSSPSGLAFSTSGTGCAPGTYITPQTLIWTPGSNCELSVISPQSETGTQYTFTQWQDGTTATTDSVTAPATSAVYTASFSTSYQLTTSAGSGGSVSAGGYYTAGTNATVTATPASGYYFVNFTGTVNSPSNPLTVAMNGPQSVTANFAQQLTPTVSVWPTASAITYGQTLASSILTGGTASTAGAFAFTDPAIAPGAGMAAQSVTFTPSNTAEYTSVTGSVEVTVNQAVATVSITNTTQTYSGSPEPVTVTTMPSGLGITVSYTGTGATSYATSTTPPTNPGSYSVLAIVTDPNYTGQQTGTLTINQVDPTVSLALLQGSPTTTPYGTTVYFVLSTATTPQCPTGTAQLYADGAASGSPVSLTGTTCSAPIQFQLSTLTAGAHSIYAAYSGDTLFETENSSTLSYTVTQDGTTVTLAASGTSVNVGQPLTFTATVAPASPNNAGAPTGTVTFYDGTTQIGTGSTLTAVAPYTSAFTTSSLAAGSHSISATFVDGDGNFGGNSSGVDVETVNLIVPTINWTPSPTTLTYGTPLGSGQLNATAVDSNNNPISGTFAYNFASGTVLPAGTVNLTATFTPADPTTYASNSASVTITVNQATPTVSVWPTASAITYGQTLSSSTLTGGTASTPGTFTFTTLGTVPAAGTSAQSVTFTPTDTVDYASVTGTVNVTVNKATPTVTFTGAPTSAAYESTFTVVATTNASTAATITAGGACKVSGSTVTITAGSGTCLLAASWAADANYLAASASQSSLAVAATPFISWATPAVITYGTALSSAQLDAKAIYNGVTVSGTFAYTPASGTVLTAGAQTLSVTFTPTNTSDFTTASGSVTLQVNQAASRITWTRPAAITYGTALSSHAT